MDERFTVKENQLLYALTIALLACPPGNAMDDPAVKTCLDAIEQHYLIGNPSWPFDVSFCDFTGYLYHTFGDERKTIATLRIDRHGRARTYRIGSRLCHAVEITDRTTEYLARKEAARGIHRINILEGLPCSTATLQQTA